MSIRIDKPNTECRLLATRGLYTFWQGDDNYVYQYNGESLVGYLCTQDAWNRIFRRPEENKCSDLKASA